LPPLPEPPSGAPPLPALELDARALPTPKGRALHPRSDTAEAVPQAGVKSAAVEEVRRATPPFSAGHEREPSQERTSAPANGAGFQPPTAPLDEALLDPISDFLRRFPEVEWACQVSDGSSVPIIGLRIASAFLTRADEIRTGVAQVAERRGSSLRVLVLGDREQMREARAQGDVFFPWRRRGKRS
jgi:hypothetical protein